MSPKQMWPYVPFNEIAARAAIRIFADGSPSDKKVITDAIEEATAELRKELEDEHHAIKPRQKKKTAAKSIATVSTKANHAMHHRTVPDPA